MCNMSSVNSIVQMVSIKKHARTLDQDSKLCSTGIKAETSVPVNNQHTTTATMTLVGSNVIICTLSPSRVEGGGGVQPA